MISATMAAERNAEEVRRWTAERRLAALESRLEALVAEQARLRAASLDELRNDLSTLLRETESRINLQATDRATTNAGILVDGVRRMVLAETEPLAIRTDEVQRRLDQYANDLARLTNPLYLPERTPVEPPKHKRTHRTLPRPAEARVLAQSHRRAAKDSRSRRQVDHGSESTSGDDPAERGSPEPTWNCLRHVKDARDREEAEHHTYDPVAAVQASVRTNFRGPSHEGLTELEPSHKEYTRTLSYHTYRLLNTDKGG